MKSVVGKVGLAIDKYCTIYKHNWRTTIVLGVYKLKGAIVTNDKKYLIVYKKEDKSAYTHIIYTEWSLHTCRISSAPILAVVWFARYSRSTECQHIEADVTNSHRFVQRKLDYRDILTGTFTTQQPATVSTEIKHTLMCKQKQST